MFSCNKKVEQNSMEKGYFITAEIKVIDSTKIELTKAELKKLRKKTLKEAGCSFFSIQQDEKEPTRFIMWERFDNETEFKKHFEYEHTKKYVAKNLTKVVQYFQTDIIE